MNKQAPTFVSGSFEFAYIGAGDWHSCAMDRNGKAWCWVSGWLGAQPGPATAQQPSPGHCVTSGQSAVQHGKLGG